jgi:hypothetical protein
MSKYQVFEFGELRFTKDELKASDQSIFSLIVGSSVAANDVAVLQRLAIFHGHRKTDSDLVKTYIGVNSLILFRLLSAKVYEYLHFIDGFARKLRRRKDNAFVDFLSMADELLKMREDREYALTKELRDNITHHYHGATDVINLETFDSDHQFSMFLHNASGNSLSPLGEDIGTFGILRSKGDGTDAKLFIDWTIKASGEIISFQHRSMVSILNKFFPKKKLVMRKVPVDAGIIGDEDTRSPLLFKRKGLR